MNRAFSLMIPSSACSYICCHIRREAARSPPFARRSAASVRSQKAAPGRSAASSRMAGGALGVVQEDEVEEAEVLPQPPGARDGCARPFSSSSMPSRGRPAPIGDGSLRKIAP